MARGYKRDSRGRFAGGYGAGALGGKGAYASRPKGGGGGAGGGTTKLQQPKAVRRTSAQRRKEQADRRYNQRNRNRRIAHIPGTTARRGRATGRGGLSTRQKTALTQIAIKGAILGGGYLAATKIMDKGEARIAAGTTVSNGRKATAPFRGGRPLGTSTYRNAGKGRIEDIGATKTGSSLKDSVFKAANPMLHKDFGNNPILKKNLRTTPSRAARPGR